MPFIFVDPSLPPPSPPLPSPSATNAWGGWGGGWDPKNRYMNTSIFHTCMYYISCLFMCIVSFVFFRSRRVVERMN